MKVLIFGTGAYYERCKKYFVNEDIIGLLDNDEKKIGLIKDEIKIFSPKEGIKQNFDKIFILSTDFIDEMKKQLIELGVETEKICTIYDIRTNLNISFDKNQVTIYSSDRQYTKLISHTEKNIAIMTNSMGINGADMTVLYVAKVLSRLYNVHIISKMDGPLREKFLELNVSVIIDESIMMKSIDQLPWVESYDLIFANGILFYNLVDTHEFPEGIEVIWWIHSSGEMNNYIPIEKLNEIPQNNVAVYGVSSRAIDSFRSMVTKWDIRELCYGIVPPLNINKTLKRNKIIFAVVGALCERKAQDLFIDAVRMIPEGKRNKCECWIIGSAGGKTFANKVFKKMKNISNVKYLGVMDNSCLMNDIYPKISVLVCPSIEDTMPVVCAEAMMFSHPCIVSKNTGTSQFIVDKENGLIVNTGDINDLSEKMEWVIDNSENIQNMGKKARQVYEKYFSIKIFEEKLKLIIEEKIKKHDA